MRCTPVALMFMLALASKAHADCDVVFGNEANVPVTFLVRDARTNAPLMTDRFRILPHQRAEVTLKGKCGLELNIEDTIAPNEESGKARKTSIIFPESDHVDGLPFYVLP